MLSLSPTDRLLVRCPRCSSPLAPVQITEGPATALASECTKCSGRWVEAAEVERAAELLGEVPAGAQSPQRPMRCPKCIELEMYTVSAPELVGGVNVCLRCNGMWLEGDERAAVEGGRLLTVLASARRFARGAAGQGK